jgi:hypothetical protein
MAGPPSQVAAVWVQDELGVTDWSPLKDVLFQAVKKQLKTSDIEVWDYVDSNLSYVAEHLRDIASDYASDGATPGFEIDTEQPPYIRLLPALPTKLLSKLRKIDPFEVESVCARLLAALGAESSATQRTNDGGVDFVAVNLNIVPGGLTIPMACKAVVIGQTKRYKDGNSISETKLREFVGAAMLKKHQLQKDGKLGPLTPVIFAFWTTSGFDPNAKRFAKEAGIWYMEGLTLASYVSTLGFEESVMAKPDCK